MASAQEVLGTLNDVKNLTAFIANPKHYVTSHGLDPEDKATSAHFELYALSLINNINASNKFAGIKEISPAWGIGAGCCNGGAAEIIRTKISRP